MIRFMMMVCLTVALTATSYAGTGTKLKTTITGTGKHVGSVFNTTWSDVYVDGETGNISHIEHFDKDGKRFVTLVGESVFQSAIRYTSQIHKDNMPSLSAPTAGGNISVVLHAPAAIEVRDTHSGEVIARYPTNGEAEETVYTVPADLLTKYKNKVIAVDVIRTSDASYHGTESVVYR